jgi:hypothetical protein
LIATSGIIYTKTADYGGAPVKMGQQVVRMTVMGEVSMAGAWEMLYVDREHVSLECARGS